MNLFTSLIVFGCFLGFAIAQTPTASATLAAKIMAVAVANGFMSSDWCVVNNTCASH
jgi:hypothetical protein